MGRPGAAFMGVAAYGEVVTFGRRAPQQPEVVRISSAPHRHSDDLDARISRYLMSMLIRTVCVVLVVVVDSPWRWVFAAGAIGLPYIAVVMANASGTRRDRDVPVPTPLPRPALPATAAPPPPGAPSTPRAIEGKAGVPGPERRRGQ